MDRIEGGGGRRYDTEDVGEDSEGETPRGRRRGGEGKAEFKRRRNKKERVQRQTMDPKAAAGGRGREKKKRDDQGQRRGGEEEEEGGRPSMAQPIQVRPGEGPPWPSPSEEATICRVDPRYEVYIWL